MVIMGVPIIPALKRLRQKDLEFKGSLGHIMRSRTAWTTQ
jgi:hypothetical protein